MLLPNYKEVIISNTKKETARKLVFDKLYVRILSNAKKQETELFYYLNPGCKRRNIDLSRYIRAVNDYLISHPYYGTYEKKTTNLFDFAYIKRLTFTRLKFGSDEFQIMNHF